MIPEKWMIKSQDSYGKNLEFVDLKSFNKMECTLIVIKAVWESVSLFFEQENRISLLRTGKMNFT